MVEKLCDTVSIIKAGNLVMSGTTEKIRGSNSLEEIFMEVVEDDKKI